MLGITTAGIFGKVPDLSNLKAAKISHIDCSITGMLGVSKIDEARFFDIESLAHDLIANEISCASLQSIFYGSPEAFFDTFLLRDHMEKFMKILTAFSCENLLFGSPSQRSHHQRSLEAVKEMNEICSSYGKCLLIENLDKFEDVWAKNTNEIGSEIRSHDLMNCKINLHIFIDEILNLDDLDLEHVKSLHISNSSYSGDLLRNFKLDTLKKVKMLYSGIPRLSVEMTQCDWQTVISQFAKFQEVWSQI